MSLNSAGCWKAARAFVEVCVGADGEDLYFSGWRSSSLVNDKLQEELSIRCNMSVVQTWYPGDFFGISRIWCIQTNEDVYAIYLNSWL